MSRLKVRFLRGPLRHYFKSMKTYEIIEHTADLGLRIFGRDLKNLFINAAGAMFEVMLEPLKKGRASPKQTKEKFLVNKSAASIEDLLVAWLSELIFLFFNDGLIVEKVDIEQLDSQGIQAEVSGRIFNPEFQRIKTEIKAVTFHELEVKQTQRGYEAQVIFDV